MSLESHFLTISDNFGNKKNICRFDISFSIYRFRGDTNTKLLLRKTYRHIICFMEKEIIDLCHQQCIITCNNTCFGKTLHYFNAKTMAHFILAIRTADLLYFIGIL